MRTLSQQAELIRHAANIIKNQASELRDAFALPDGSYHSKDQDIEAEIMDMYNTATNLKFLLNDIVLSQ
ncbi:MAG: hypothetical protein JKY41_11705 [Rhodobacteraceae bacterium]|nr:hypothetical protein [Paracoccaceae bacterium]